mmetsp:Transcript_7497/g.11123  ORF Transcript_7497/g.11123 Transcript_7497/m.11123 type:complete len:945 (-) Transcript_7497:1-2835(-)
MSQDQRMEAFELVKVALEGKKVNGIESMAVCDNILYIGSNNGYLHSFHINYNNKEKGKVFKCKHITSTKLDKGSVTQIVTIPEYKLIFSLCNTVVRLHLLDLQLIPNTTLKSVTKFTIKKHKNDILIAAATKGKKIKIYSFVIKQQQSEFQFRLDISVPQHPLSMRWANEYICVGFKSQYQLIQPSTNQSTRLIELDSDKIKPYIFSNAKEIYISKNFTTILLANDGKPIRNKGISWPSPPLFLAYLNPYIICALANHIEIKFLKKDSKKKNHKKDIIVQAIPIIGMSVTSQSTFLDYDNVDKKMDEGVGLGGKSLPELDPNDTIDPEFRIFMSNGKDTINALCMKKFSLQVQDYQKNRHFNEALALCERYKNTKHEIPKKLYSDIHFEQGFYLFHIEDYEGAISHFEDSKVDPRSVLPLYASILPTFPTPIKENYSFVPSILTSIANGFQQNPNKRIQALRSLVTYLEGLKTRGVVRTASHIIDKAHKRNISEEGTKTSIAVDTSLLCAYLELEDHAKVNRLLNISNYCDLAESVKKLEEKKKYKELVLFYKQKGKDVDALVALYHHGKKKDGNELAGVQPTIDYLKQLNNAKLVSRYSIWSLEVDPIASVDIFTREDCPLTHNEVLDHFEQKSSQKRESKIVYLEWLVNVRDKDPKAFKYAERQDIHEKLAQAYLNYVKEDVKGEQKRLWDIQDVRKRFQSFLKSSNSYSTSSMDTLLALTTLDMERVIVLCKIRADKNALQLLIRKIKDMNQVEEYCVTRYEQSQKDSSITSETCDVFITALREVLNFARDSASDSTSIESNLEAAAMEFLSIMERNFDKIDMIKAIEELPPSLPLHTLTNFHTQILRQIAQQKNQADMKFALAQAETARVEAAHYKMHSEAIKIKNTTLCPICENEIGNQSFVRYPNGILVHFVCMEDEHVCPITGHNFKDDTVTNVFDI